MGRRCQAQPRCGEAKGGVRARSSSRFRLKGSPNSVARPAEEVQLREPIAAMEEADNDARETEQDVTIMCDLIANWVDIVADDLVEEEVDENMPYEELDAEFWETMSSGSVEDYDEIDVLESEPHMDEAPVNSDEVDVLEPEPLMGETPMNEPSVNNLLHLLKQVIAQVAPKAPAPEKVEQEVPAQEEVQKKIAIVEQVEEVDVPLMASPLPSPCSRSSTPGRPVRNHRRVFGGITRPAWDVASAASVSPPSSNMKRAVSTSALALDLGPAAAPEMASNVATPAASCTRSQRPVEFRITQGRARNCVKSKSMGALHATGSKNGLGLTSPMLSLTSNQGGLLPALGSDRHSSKAELVAWSVSLSKAKRGGLRLVF